MNVISRIVLIFLTASLAVMAQQVGAVFGGVVLAPDCGQQIATEHELKYVCAGGHVGEYTIRYPKGIGSEDVSTSEFVEVPIELLNLGEPEIDWTVEKLSTEKGYRYSYVLTNGRGARRAIWSWALVIPSDDDTAKLQHPLWRPTSPSAIATNAVVAPQAAILDGPQLRRSASLGKFARWTTSLDEYPVTAGSRTGSFAAESAFRPGWTTAYASAGKGIEVPYEMPAEISSELEILQRPENEQSIVLTIGPKFGADVSAQWIAADWHLGVQKLVNRGSLSGESTYVKELLNTLEQIAKGEAWIALSTNAKPSAGFEDKIHRAATLALEPRR